MLKQILSAIKISALALVLSFGLSYALAWTTPTQNPPSGNVEAPINIGATTQTKVGGDVCTTVSGVTKCLQTAGGGVTPPAGSEFLDTSATAQTKVGDLNVSGSIGIGIGTSTPAQKLDVAGSAQITGTIYGGGAQTTYGATTIRGEKNGWSGINFKNAAGSNSGTLMMHPSYSGFFNATDNKWRMYVEEPVGSASYGRVVAQDYYIGATGILASQLRPTPYYNALYWGYRSGSYSCYAHVFPSLDLCSTVCGGADACHYAGYSVN